MLLVAQVSNHPSITFPEAGALAAIVFVIRQKAVLTRAYLIVTLATLDATAGVVATRVIRIAAVGEMAALALVLTEIYWLRSSLVPLISVTMLPVVFHITSPFYVLSVLVVTGTLTVVTTFENWFTSKSAQGYSEGTESSGEAKDQSLEVAFVFFCVGTLWIGATNLYLPLFFMAPPIFVSALDWLRNRRSESKFILTRSFLLLFAASVGELGYQYLGHIPGSIAAFSLTLFVASWSGDLHPPLLAISILPQVVRPTQPILYISGVLAGTLVLYLGGALALSSLNRFNTSRLSIGHAGCRIFGQSVKQLLRNNDLDQPQQHWMAKSMYYGGVMERRLLSSGTEWEPIVGYSRAVQVGGWIMVAGTTAAAEGGGAVGGNDIGEQTREALRRIATALEELGAGLEHVVRTRIYVTDISRWLEVGHSHCEVFGSIRPASSMVEVSRLIDPALLVEIEADAIVPYSQDSQGSNPDPISQAPLHEI